MKESKKEKIVREILNEMYLAADNLLGLPKMSFDELVKYAVQIDDKKHIPFFAFYLDENTQKNIINKHTKYLRNVYIMSEKDPNFENYLADVKAGLSTKELRKKYILQKRCYDRDFISFNVFNFAPNSCYETVKKISELYLGVRNDTTAHDRIELDILTKFIDSFDNA